MGPICYNVCRKKNCIYRDLSMRTRVLLKVAALAGILALTGCAAKVAQPDQYSGFLKDYSSLKETTSASGKPELRWIDPNFNPANYDNIVYHPVT